MTELVQFTEHPTHCLIQMDDGKANALSFAMFDALNDALDQALELGKAILLTGRPGKFSAGFDLSVMGEGGDTTLRLLRAGADFAGRLMACPTPVVLAVNGHALAMGAIVCLAADYRVGTLGSYKIGLNEVAIGMTMPWFGVELARERIAGRHFNRAVALATIYEPEGAVAAGFLDEAVAEDTLISRATEVAAALSVLNPAAHRNSKVRIREQFQDRYQQALERDFDQGEAIAQP